MNPTASITLRFAFVALSTLFGALGFALLAMVNVHSAYVAVNGAATAPDNLLFILPVLGCICAAPPGGSLAFLAAVFVLYLRNMHAERTHQAV